jgi:hypothetical protein
MKKLCVARPMLKGFGALPPAGKPRSKPISWRRSRASTDPTMVVPTAYLGALVTRARRA